MRQQLEGLSYMMPYVGVGRLPPGYDNREIEEGTVRLDPCHQRALSRDSPRLSGVVFCCEDVFL